MKHSLVLIIVTFTLCLPCSASGQIQVGGLLDMVAKNSGEPDITNPAFSGASPLHTARARLFFDASLGDHNAAFVQLLVDDYDIFLYGAYVRFSSVIGPHVNIHVGMIPNPIGNWGPRIYSNVNPLVGVPLVWTHHSTYNPRTQTPPATVDELLASRDSRTRMGLPLLYDNCWNTGAEIYGSAGAFDYSIAVLSGSLTKPSIQQHKDIPQFTSRLAYVFGPELTVGFNGFTGPYLWDGMLDGLIPRGKSHDDYLNAGVGYDLAFVRGYLELYSELFYEVWEHPTLPDLDAASGYVEAKYKFLPGWYAAGRVGFFETGKLTDSSGKRRFWDYPLKRYEFGLGYHPNRRTIIKAVTQLNRFDSGGHLDTEHYLLQLSVTL